MSTQGIDIPVKIEGNDALIMLARIVNALEGVGNKAQSAAPKAEHLGVSLRGVGEAARHINEVRELVTSFAESLINAAERVGELAGEQQRLDANSARMGLNFQQAAAQAGGFVSEMQAMTLATALANRGINVTQRELESLARVGMARASAAGKNVEEVFDSIGDSIIEGGEELEKFGSSLHSVADESHTASERLTALVQRGREVTPAMRTASDNVASFRNELQQTGRYVSTGFVEEMSRLQEVTGSMRQGATDAVEFRREMEAIGQTAALMLTGIGNAAGIIIGGIATSVSLMVAGIAAAQAGLHALATRGNAASAARAAFESFGTRDVAAFTRARVEGFGALFSDARHLRTVARPEAAPSRPSDLTVTREEMMRRGGSSGGGSQTAASDVELARVDAALEIAARLTPAMREARFGMDYEEIGGVVVRARGVIERLRRERIDILRGQIGERRQGESARDRRRRVAQTTARVDELEAELRATGESEATSARSRFATQGEQARREYEERIGRPVGGAGGNIRERAEAAVGKERGERETVRGKQVTDLRLDAQLAQERMADRERRMLDERRDGLRSFTDFMEGQYTRQVNLAREGADAVAMSVRAMGSAYADNLVAWAEGSKTFEEAANAMLATTLSTIAKEAAQKSAFNVAEGLFALATYRYDAAALHFAAAAGYGALAYGAGYAASAVREAAPQKEGQGDRAKGAGSGASAAPMSQGSTTGGGTTVINVAFNGPQFGTGGVVQAARQLVGVINNGAVQGGVQLNRLAIPARV